MFCGILIHSEISVHTGLVTFNVTFHKLVPPKDKKLTLNSLMASDCNNSECSEDRGDVIVSFVCRRIG